MGSSRATRVIPHSPFPTSYSLLPNFPNSYVSPSLPRSYRVRTSTSCNDSGTGTPAAVRRTVAVAPGAEAKRR